MDERGQYRLLPNRQDHNCFGCSPSNPYGLHLQIYAGRDSVVSWITVPGHLCGWDTLVHGGILATILDEVMGRAVIFQLKSLLLTKSMTVDFLKPVFVGVELKAEAKVVEVRNGREAVAEGGIYNAAGELCTKSSGTFVLMDPGTAKRKGLADDEFMRWFDSLVRT
jgi:uncharacterized protein (TIGR00369 family)